MRNQFYLWQFPKRVLKQKKRNCVRYFNLFTIGLKRFVNGKIFLSEKSQVSNKKINNYNRKRKFKFQNGQVDNWMQWKQFQGERIPFRFKKYKDISINESNGVFIWLQKRHIHCAGLLTSYRVQTFN